MLYRSWCQMWGLIQHNVMKQAQELFCLRELVVSSYLRSQQAIFLNSEERVTWRGDFLTKPTWYLLTRILVTWLLCATWGAQQVVGCSIALTRCVSRAFLKPLLAISRNLKKIYLNFGYWNAQDLPLRCSCVQFRSRALKRPTSNLSLLFDP